MACYIHLLGNGEANGPSSRLRRAVSMATYDPITHATIIDSVGNARSEQSLQILSDHVTRSHDSKDKSHDLTIRHAAVNALGGLESKEVHYVCEFTEWSGMDN